MANRERVYVDNLLCELMTARGSVQVLRLFEMGEVSVVRGVIIIWDKDFDDRAIDFVNSLPDDALTYVRWVAIQGIGIDIGVCTGTIIPEIAEWIGCSSADTVTIGENVYDVIWWNAQTQTEVTGQRMA
jgi:hypothetical protein